VGESATAAGQASRRDKNADLQKLAHENPDHQVDELWGAFAAVGSVCVLEGGHHLGGCPLGGCPIVIYAFGERLVWDQRLRYHYQKV
jgi:hypothetical protein